MPSVVEIEAKIERIRELTKLGFNTPRMFYVSPIALISVVDEAVEWCNQIGHPTYNIRTYTYNVAMKAEGHATPHYTDIPLKDIRQMLIHLKGKFACMVDAEIPDNGRFAGNIMLYNPDFRGRIQDITIEYCVRDKRAMVRDHDKSISLPVKQLDDLPYTLRTVADASLKFPRPTILEWTYFCEPAGIKNENLVWWEHRRI